MKNYKSKKKRWTFHAASSFSMSFLGVVLLILTMSGCALNRPNLVRDGFVELEILPNEGKVEIGKVRVFNKNTDLVIAGTVERRAAAVVRRSHVDIAILSPDGKVIEALSTHYTPSFARIRNRKSNFSVSLPVDLPQDGKIRVALHTQSVKNTFNCGHNIAS